MLSGGRRALPSILLCVIAVIVVTYRVSAVQAERVRAFGRLSPKQVLGQSESLAHDISEMSDALLFAAYKATIYTRGGRAKRLWTVNVSDARGDMRVAFDWDADGRKLVRVNNASPTVMRSDLPLLPPHRAVQITRTWLHVLGVKVTAPVWRADVLEHSDTSSRVEGVYSVHWRAPDREAIVHIRDRTGDLIHADLLPRQSAAGARRATSE